MPKKIHTPECDKMLKVKDQSQIIGEFLDWLQHGTDYVISEWDESEPEILYPANVSIEKLLADYFDIDLNKIEKERRKILESLKS